MKLRLLVQFCRMLAALVWAGTAFPFIVCAEPPNRQSAGIGDKLVIETDDQPRMDAPVSVALNVAATNS